MTMTIAVAAAICAVLLGINVRGLYRRHRLVLALPLLAGLGVTVWVGYWLALNGTMPNAVTWAGPAVIWMYLSFFTALGSTFDRHWQPMLIGFTGFAAAVVGVIQSGFL